MSTWRLGLPLGLVLLGSRALGHGSSSRRLRLEKESKHAFRRAKMTKTGVNGGKGGPTRSGGAFISTLAPEGGEAP